MPSSIGICIRCGQNVQLISSHIISEFMRNAFFGTSPKKSESVRMPHHRRQVDAYTSKLRVTKKAGAQSLPTQSLMCRSCDSELGSNIEHPVAKLISHLGLARHPGRIYGLDRNAPMCETIDSPFGESVHTGGPRYFYREYDELPGEVALCARLSCWRAMHAMARDGHSLVSAFLSSSSGQKIDTDVKLIWNGQTDHADSYDDVQLFVVPAELLIDTMGGSDVLLPFGWYWVEGKVQQGAALVGTVVWCAHWVAFWRPTALMGCGPLTMIQFIQDALAGSRAQLRSRVASIGSF